MDDHTAVLREEFSKLLRKAAELKVTLDRADGTVQGIPHYSVIEETAHQLGREVSRMVQAMHLNAMVADYPQFARCPKCETRCKLQPEKRTVLSGDGPVEIQELVGQCPCCRRAFFPAT
jgi:uncharacterized protein with PIN domain